MLAAWIECETSLISQGGIAADAVKLPCVVPSQRSRVTAVSEVMACEGGRMLRAAKPLEEPVSEGIQYRYSFITIIFICQFHYYCYGHS